MDNRPIGVFDSGVGGLTAARALHAAYPQEEIVYLGDTANVPYGGRSREELIGLSTRGEAFLLSQNVKAVLIACNTSTCNAWEALSAQCGDVPLVGTVSASVDAAVRATKNRRVGIWATEATIRSGLYQRLLHEQLQDVEIFSIPCPALVPLIEGGHIHPGDAALEAAVAAYTAPLRHSQVDTLILGCTHYPLISPVIAAALGERVALIDSGAECAHAIMAQLRAQNALAAPTAAPQHRYCCTARLEEFVASAQVFLGRDIAPQAQEIHLTAY